MQIVEPLGVARKDAEAKHMSCPYASAEDAARGVDGRRDACGPFDTRFLAVRGAGLGYVAAPSPDVGAGVHPPPSEPSLSHERVHVMMSLPA